MFEMIMKLNETLYGKIFVLKKMKSKKCFTNNRNKVFLPWMCVLFFVVSAFIASADSFTKVFGSGFLPSTKEVKVGHSILNPPPREAKYIPLLTSSRHKFSSAHR